MHNIITEYFKKHPKKEEIANILLELFPIYNITTKNRICHFLSQSCHESADFSILQENLNYSAESLLKVFPKYFKDINIAKEYERKPEKIANVIYANRMGNGDQKSGDGFKFIGRGVIQLTGKNNYKLFSESIYKNDFLLHNPTIVAKDLKIAILTGLWFWDVNKLNILADTDNLLLITKKINGGTHGIEDRKSKLIKFQNLI
jgi:putative chitinase